MHWKGVAKGKIIELDEVLPYAEGCLVNVIVEPETVAFQTGAPAMIRQVMHEPPHLVPEEVDELEQTIAAGQLPAHDRGVFDDGR